MNAPRHGHAGLPHDSHRDECGVTTAEYSVGTLAATGFAALLYLSWPWIEALLRASLVASGRFPTQIQGWRGM